MSVSLCFRGFVAIYFGFRDRGTEGIVDTRMPAAHNPVMWRFPGRRQASS